MSEASRSGNQANRGRNGTLGGTSGAGGSRSADPDPTHPATSSNLTIAGSVHLDESPNRNRSGRSLTSADGRKQKICCSCGKDVAHEERFKDRTGHYWCMDCGVEENRRKHTIGAAPEKVKCADCEEDFAADELVERDRMKVCPGCADKRDQHAAKEAARAAARKAAIEQESRDAERRKRTMLIAAGVLAAVAVVWMIYVLAF